MERTTALLLLPETHARALTLEAEGLDASELAARLDVDESAVAPLLQVARAKLATLETLEEPAREPSGRARRKTLRVGLIAASIALVSFLLVAIVGPYVYIHFIAPDPPKKLSFAKASAAAPGAKAGATIAGTWEVAAGSAVGYRVNELLAGQKNTAVGRTIAVTGNVSMTDTAVRSAVFTVDVAKITSNSSQRDQSYQAIMDTQTFPTATFTLTRPITLAAVPANLRQISVPVAGDLTLHGVTKAVAFDLKARRNGAKIEVNGSIPIAFSQYGIANPRLPMISVQDHGELEFLLVLAHQ